MDINIFSLCLTLLSAGLLAYLCACQSQNEKSSWQSLWHWAALFVCIASIVFLSTTAGIYWKSNKASDFWNLATMVFTFFGILLTAGAAFATVAAAVSYFSVNQKLADAQKQLQLSQKQLQEMQESVLRFKNLSQEIKNSLQEAEHSLNEFKQLDQERQKLKKALEETANYQSVMQDLARHDAANIDEEMQEKSLQAAKQILENSQADFEARLKAHAIIQDDKIYQKFEQVEANPSVEEWQEVIAMRQDNLIAWKLLFQATTEVGDAHNKAQNNYAIALFNYGRAMSFSSNYLYRQDKKNQAMEQYRDAGEQYKLALNLKPDMYKAANNWGVALNREARFIATRGDLEEARKLWKQSDDKYNQVLEIKADYDIVAKNWLLSFKKQAHYLSGTEQIQLWQNARTQVLQLQNHSPEHQQSEVIQNLLKKIGAEIQKLSSQEHKP